MGYEQTALIAVNEDYKDIDWGEWKDSITTEVVDEGFRTVYRVEWSKFTGRLVDYFLEEIAKKDCSIEDNSLFLDNDTFGIIIIGEEESDIETWGSFWDFDIELHRSLSIY